MLCSWAKWVSNPSQYLSKRSKVSPVNIMVMVMESLGVNRPSGLIHISDLPMRTTFKACGWFIHTCNLLDVNDEVCGHYHSQVIHQAEGLSEHKLEMISWSFPFCIPIPSLDPVYDFSYKHISSYAISLTWTTSYFFCLFAHQVGPSVKFKLCLSAACSILPTPLILPQYIWQMSETKPGERKKGRSNTQPHCLKDNWQCHSNWCQHSNRGFFSILVLSLANFTRIVGLNMYW